MVANPARGQLGKKHVFFPVPVRAWECGLARRVRPSRPTSARSSPYSGLIWCLLTGSLPLSATASTCTVNRHRVSPEFIADGVHCRESAGTGPAVLKVVRVTGAAFSAVTMVPFCAPLFSHTHCGYVVDMCNSAVSHRIALREQTVFLFYEILPWLQVAGSRHITAGRSTDMRVKHHAERVRNGSWW